MDKCDRVCAYCGKHEVKARGLCNACYIRLQRNGDCKYKRRKTNADRIRSMTDEELADWLGVYCNGQTAQEVGKPCVSGMGSCEECWLDWLREEVTDG